MTLHGIFLLHVNTCASKWTRNGKLKLKLVCPEKKKNESMTRKNANPVTCTPYFISN